MKAMPAMPPPPVDPYGPYVPPRERIEPYPPLPWIYRDPQCWLAPALILIAVVAAALVLG